MNSLKKWTLFGQVSNISTHFKENLTSEIGSKQLVGLLYHRYMMVTNVGSGKTFDILWGSSN